jgi:Na+-driven multidrug efflux pump
MGSVKRASETQPLVPKLASDEEDPLLTAPDLETPSIASDAWDIIQLGAPIFVSRLSFVGMKTTDTALLGHVSREALSASALSDLWTMCSQVLLNGSILGVLVG